MFSEIGGFAWAVASNWLLWVGGGLMTLLALWERWRSREIHWSLYSRLLVCLLFVAFFSAWKEAKDETRAAREAENRLSQELASARDENASLRLGIEERQRQINVLRQISDDLRDKLADVRNLRPVDVKVSGAALPTMTAVTEGVRATWRQIPSPVDTAPYAWEVTVQVAAPVEPFGVFVQTTSRPDGVRSFGAVRIMVSEFVRDNGAYVGWQSPAVTPQSPAILQVWGKEPFRVLGVERVR